MMKNSVKWMAAGLAAVTLLAGCGSAASSSASEASSAAGNGSSAASSSAQSTAESESADSSAAGEAAASASTASAGAGNVLVVYFSASGNTKNIAEMIAADTGADTFEVVPAEPYTDDDLNWTDEDSRVNREHEDESLQDVKLVETDVPNWDSYDTVFVGYPIWWQDASWVLKSFVKNEDFSGKTVIPFCTSSSSDIGESGSNLEKLAGTGDWQEGMRFSGGASEEEVQDWVSSLNL